MPAKDRLDERTAAFRPRPTGGGGYRVWPEPQAIGFRETNGQGQIIMNPPIGLTHASARPDHRGAQGEPAGLADLAGGWHSHRGRREGARPRGRSARIRRGDRFARLPGPCARPLHRKSTDPPSNTWEEMRHKSLLHLAAVARRSGCATMQDASISSTARVSKAHPRWRPASEIGPTERSIGRA